MVALIACANISNLPLARATVRHRELAMRRALGAGRSRLVRQMLTEGMLLALLAGVVSLLLAHWALVSIVSFGPKDIPRLASVGLNGAVPASLRHEYRLEKAAASRASETQNYEVLAGTRPSPPTPDRTKSLDDSPSHDRLETDSHSIRSFALLF